MKILVIGASGLVGGNIFELMNKINAEVLGTHHSFITRNTLFFDAVEINHPKNSDVLNFKPDYIIHCGALTNVDYCERNPKESYEQTVMSTKNIFDLAIESKSKIVYLSTDYVFDGTKGCYDEEDKTCPINVYGRHKLEAEEIVRENSENLIVRVTNVYGNELQGKNFVSRLLKNILSAEEVSLRLPIDQYATPINAFDIARAILILIEKKSSGIYHLASTDYLNRCQLAEIVMNYFNCEKVKIDKVTTELLGQYAMRPLRGGMIAHKFLSENPEFIFNNINEYLRQQNGIKKYN